MHQNPFNPAGGAYDAPPDPIVGWGGGYPLPIPLPARRLRRLELGAYGASVLRPPSTQNPGYASGNRLAEVFAFLLAYLSREVRPIAYVIGRRPIFVGLLVGWLVGWFGSFVGISCIRSRHSLRFLEKY